MARIKRGVTAKARHKEVLAQAKAVGEWLRARVVEIPQELLHVPS